MTNSIFSSFSYICAIALCVIPIVFGFMVDGAYSESYGHIPILLLGALFTVGLGLLQSIYIGMKKTKKVAKTSTYCAVLNIAINLILINYIGVYAASLSTLCSYVALSVYRYIDLKKIYGFRIMPKKIMLPAFMIVVGCLLYYLALPSIVYVIVAILMSIIAITINLNTIKKARATLLKKRTNNDAKSLHTTGD